MQDQLSPRQWRQRQKLTLAAVAALVGVNGKNPARTWHRWERGEGRPSACVIAKIEAISKGVVSVKSWAAVQEQCLVLAAQRRRSRFAVSSIEECATS